MIYRRNQPTTARRIEPDGLGADEVRHAEVHFLPSPLELIELKWAAAAIGEYRLTYSRGCFCAVTGAVTFEVRDGQATLVDSANGYNADSLRRCCRLRR